MIPNMPKICKYKTSGLEVIFYFITQKTLKFLFVLRVKSKPFHLKVKVIESLDNLYSFKCFYNDLLSNNVEPFALMNLLMFYLQCHKIYRRCQEI